MYRVVMFFLIISFTGAFAKVTVTHYAVHGPSSQPFSYGVDYDTVFVTKDFKINSNLIFYVEKINGLSREFFLGHKLIIPKNTIIAQQFCPVEKIRFDYITIDSMVVVDKTKNLFMIYRYGVLLRWGPVTRGRKFTYTPSGNFFMDEKDEMRISRKYHNAPMPFSWHIQDNLCLHQGPMPGHPDSKGCIRTLMEDAIWIYNWGKNKIKLLVL